MKFYCDACNTKYAISDEKVRGKVLKVRCKNCSAIITVREAQTPATASRGSGSAPSAPSPPPSAPAAGGNVPTTNWYYALNGQTFGPFTLSALRDKYQRAELSDATYVWHEKLVEWKPVTTVDAFKDAVAQGHQIRPRRKTIGFSGELQAIQATDRPEGLQTGAVPRQSQASPAEKSPGKEQQSAGPASAQPTSPRRPSRPAQQPVKSTSRPKPKPEQKATPGRPARPEPAKKPAAASPSPDKPEKKELRDPRRDKLERLRKRLSSDAPLSTSGTDFSPTAEAAPADPKARPAVPQQSKPEPETSSAPKAEPEPPQNERSDLPAAGEALPSPVGGEAMFTFADGVTPASAESSQELQQPPRDAIDFGLPPRASEPKPSPSSRSDILDQVIGPTEQRPVDSNGAKPVDSGVIPFFADAPELAASDKIAPPTDPSSSQTSGSLLIQIDQIKKEGRGKRWIIGVVVGMLAVSLGGAAAFMALSNTPKKPTGDSQPSIGQQPGHKDELVINRYSKDEQTKLATLELEEEMLFDEAETDEESSAEEPKEGSAATKPKPTAAKEESGSRKSTGSKAAKGTGAAVKAETGAKEATNDAKSAVASAEEEPEAAKEEEDDVYKALLSARAGKSTAIKAPEDKILDGAGNSTGLSKDQARRGFQRVKKSVRDCRERHNRHNARLDAGKIKLSVTVQPNGRVSKFVVNPASVRNTEFERCMQSHKGRWHFAPFGGKEVVINTSIIMQ